MVKIFKNEYWDLSRIPAVGLLFVVPLWMLYEIFAFRANHGWSGNQRTGIDFFLKKCFESLGLGAGFLFALIILGFLAYMLLKLNKIRIIKKNPYILVLMFLESVAYAIVFGLVLGGLMTIFFSINNVEIDQAKVASFVKNLGSGVYEELFFRLFFISGFIYLMKYLVNNYQRLLYFFAVTLSSIFFALFHHLDIFNEPFQWQLFVFRMIAGAAFSVLFVFRGYGITAYTHTFYNLFLMFR